MLLGIGDPCRHQLAPKLASRNQKVQAVSAGSKLHAAGTREHEPLPSLTRTQPRTGGGSAAMLQPFDQSSLQEDG